MSPRICYVPKQFSDAHEVVIEQANSIITEYEAQGFTLTLRQVYYQFVARGWIANTQRDYKRLGSIINAGRLAGEIDWDAIEDRTRGIRDLSKWDDPSDIIKSAARSYHEDLWEGQQRRVEVWIEKDALVGVLLPTCEELDVPVLSCRGYTSQTEMWIAAMRLVRWSRLGYETLVLHFGDHDPSGIDMTRDIRERLALFAEQHGQPAPEVQRIALNMDQVEEFNPPPNPAKTTDSRFESYLREHGEDSWELDALEPAVLASLVREHIEKALDEGTYKARVNDQERNRERLQHVADHWDDLLIPDDEDE